MEALETLAAQNSKNPDISAALGKKLLNLQTGKTYSIITTNFGIYDVHNAEKAIDILKEAGARGSQAANIELANLYLNGNFKAKKEVTINMPVNQNLALARIYACAALNGDNPYYSAKANEFLGLFSLAKNHKSIFYAQPVPENIDSALEYFVGGAELGSSKAAEALASIYMGIPISATEYLVEPNLQAAIGRLKRAADMGSNQAKIKLALNFFTGRYVKQDIGLAAKYVESIEEESDNKKRFSTTESAIAAEMYAMYCQLEKIIGKDSADADAIRNEIDDYHRFVVNDLYAKDAIFNKYAPNKYWTTKIKEYNSQEIKIQRQNELLAERLSKMPEKEVPDKDAIMLALLYPSKNAQPYAERELKRNNILAMLFLASNATEYPQKSRVREQLKIECNKRNINSYFLDSATDTNIENFKTITDENVNLVRSVVNNILYNTGAEVNIDPEKFFSLIDKLVEYEKGNSYAELWATMKMLGIGTPIDVDAAIAVLERKSLMRGFSTYILLAYANSAAPNMKSNKADFKKYTLLAQKNRDILPSYFSFANKFIIKTCPEFLLRLSSITGANDVSDEGTLGNISISKLESLIKIQPDNENIKSTLALKLRGYTRHTLGDYDNSPNYRRSRQLFAEIYKANPKHQNARASVAENLCASNDEAKIREGKKMFKELLNEATENYNEVVNNIFKNALTSYANYYGSICVKIPKDIMLEKISQLDGEEMKSNIYEIVSYLREHGESALANKFEMAALSDAEPNIIANKARKLLQKRSPENDAEAFKLFDSLSKNKRSNFCANELAIMYFYGIGTQKNPEKAFEIFDEHATKHNDITSIIWCALMSEEGIGTKKNPDKARAYLDRARANGTSQTYHEFWWCGIHLLYGNGVNHYKFPKNEKLGIALIKEAALAKTPDTNAFLEYATILEKGKYTKRNLSEAAKFYIKFAVERTKEDLDEGGNCVSMYWGYESAIRIYKVAPDCRNPVEAARLTQKWLKDFPQSINANVESAILSMFGIGVEKDLNRAKSLLENAINLSKEKSDDSSSYAWRAYGTLISAYLQGWLGEKNPAKVNELLKEFDKLKTSRCGVAHPYLELAYWFSPNYDIFNNDIVCNPALPQSKELSMFWIEQLERYAMLHKKPSPRVWYLKREANFFKSKDGIADAGKLAEVEKLIAEENKKIEEQKSLPSR